MCTVTFTPTDKGIYLTSSRDEHHKRSKALPPQPYYRRGYEIIFPKDPDAGGTWIALKDKKEAAVLLNGAFRKHIPQPPYRKSRGRILLEILATGNPVNGFKTLLLSGIEPFTLILFSGDKLVECRWDGIKKYQQQLDSNIPRIWSSATLYDEATTQERESWFKQWLTQHGEITTEAIMGFHQSAGNGDSRNSILMNRDNIMETVSITSLFIGKEQTRIRYRDIQSATDFQNTFLHAQSMLTEENFWQRLSQKLTRDSIRLTHWEYWPSYLVYFPVYFYWLWLSLRARSFFFFSAANPGIQYSGFTQERKSDICHLIPQQYHPLTLLCQPGTGGKALVEKIGAMGLTFPLIAKPDIGERGIQVKLLHSEAMLEHYSLHSKVDFLLQEFIPYELEAGIFYYRVPGEEKGHISGIVAKEFLSVTGDGLSTIEELIRKRKRSLLQLPDLKRTHGDFLNTVLKEGSSFTLVPYGNHSRGSKFLDESWRISPQLTAVIDQVCQQIPGFYFGRLDIKFKSWELLLEGKEFSIIELNGAGSEPTHIYDPKHSLLFAWREICRHWKLMFRISRLNIKLEGARLMSFSEGIKMRKDRIRHLKLITQ